MWVGVKLLLEVWRCRRFSLGVVITIITPSPWWLAQVRRASTPPPTTRPATAPEHPAARPVAEDR